MAEMRCQVNLLSDIGIFWLVGSNIEHDAICLINYVLGLVHILRKVMRRFIRNQYSTKSSRSWKVPCR